MSEETTQNISGGSDGRSFEERVFARFDALDSSARDLDSRVRDVDSSIHDLDAHLQKLETRAYDTKPIWEHVLKEIVETRRELSKRLDRIEAIVHETRADLRDAEDRIGKLESEPAR